MSSYRAHAAAIPSRSMLKSGTRWFLFLLAILAVGPVVGWLTGSLRGPADFIGSAGLLSTQPTLGLLRAALAVILAAVVGLLTARLISFRSAFFFSGCALAWAAFGTGTLADAARAHRSASIVYPLLAEGALLSIVAFLFAAAMLILARGHDRLLAVQPPLRLALWSGPYEGAHSPHHPHADASSAEPLANSLSPSPATIARDLAGALIIAAAAAVLASYLVAQTDLKGQTVAAAAAAGIIAGAAITLGRIGASPAFLVLALGVAGAAGPLAALLLHGSDPARGFLALAEARSIARIARPMPLDWLAGALLGIPVGLAFGSWLRDAFFPRHVPAHA